MQRDLFWHRSRSQVGYSILHNFGLGFRVPVRYPDLGDALASLGHLDTWTLGIKKYSCLGNLTDNFSFYNYPCVLRYSELSYY